MMLWIAVEVAGTLYGVDCSILSLALRLAPLFFTSCPAKQWAADNKMTINSKKTKEIVF